MHIGFQTSGGRGEYEVVGNHTGYSAMSLEGWYFHLRWPDGLVRDAGLMLEPADSGKPRLRSQLTPPFQIGRTVAAMLMLPDPRRELPETGTSPFVAVEKGYILSRLGFGPDTEFAPFTDMVTIDPSFVLLANQLNQETIGVRQRFARIQDVYDRKDDLSQGVRKEVEAHQAVMSSGATIDSALVAIVRKLGQAVAVALPGFTKDRDPLEGLERLLGIPLPIFTPLLPPPDEIGEEEPEVSVRAAHEYRLAKTRGYAARVFSQAVRTAYDHRCAFCGARYGGVPGIRSGVDAAHILAWSNFNLDVVSNGITLCKLHHWAFDAGLLLPVSENNILTMRFTALSLEFDGATRARLGTDGFTVPDEWLPSDPAKRPSKTYIDRLHADLGVALLA